MTALHSCMHAVVLQHQNPTKRMSARAVGHGSCRSVGPRSNGTQQRHGQCADQRRRDSFLLGCARIVDNNTECHLSNNPKLRSCGPRPGPTAPQRASGELEVSTSASSPNGIALDLRRPRTGRVNRASTRTPDPWHEIGRQSKMPLLLPASVACPGQHESVMSRPIA